MASTKLILPWRGVSDVAPFVEMPGDLAAPGDPLNVIPRRRGASNGSAGRRQLASRPGTVLAFPQILPGVPQCAGNVTKATGISGYTSGGKVNLVGGTSQAQSKYRTQLVVLDSNWSILFTLEDSRQTAGTFPVPAAGSGGPGGFYTCWNRTDPTIGYFCTLTKMLAETTQNVWIGGLNRFSTTLKAITHQAYVVDSDAPYVSPLGAGPPTQADSFPNEITQYGPYLFVAVRNYIYTFSAADLTYLWRTECPWAIEVQAIKPIEMGGRHYLLALFTGSAAITGPVIADSSATYKEAFGEHFRTGVGLFELAYANSDLTTYPPAQAPAVPIIQPAGSATLIPRSMIRGTTVGNPAYELHQTYRISEWSITAPIGRLAYDFAVASDGTIYVGSANQGFGYDPITIGALTGPTNQAPNGPTNPCPRNTYIALSRHILARAFEADAPATALNQSTIAYMDPLNPIRYGCSDLVGGWERDVEGGSYRRLFNWNGVGTCRCDIPAIIAGSRNPANENYAPTVYAVILVESVDCVVVAGRRPAVNAERPNVFCFDGSTGVVKWSAAVVGLIQQNAIAYDPTTGNVVVAGNRNANWIDPSAPVLTITGITAAVSAVVTTSTAHGLVAGDLVNCAGTNSGVSIDGVHVVTASTPFTFTIGVNTSAGAAGTAGTARRARYAEAWELDIGNGSIVRAWDFTSAVNVNGYIADGYSTTGAYDVSINSNGIVMLALAPFRYDT